VNPHQVTLLPGSHLSPADIDELREIIEAFGLTCIVLPDISGSLDGHIPPDWRGTTLGGTTLEQIRAAGASAFTLGVWASKPAKRPGTASDCRHAAGDV
jgi:nitrogenase molybdenum-iron protein NifN